MGDEMTSLKNIMAIVYFAILIILGVMSIVGSVMKLANPESEMF